MIIELFYNGDNFDQAPAFIQACLELLIIEPPEPEEDGFLIFRHEQFNDAGEFQEISIILNPEECAALSQKKLREPKPPPSKFSPL